MLYACTDRCLHILICMSWLNSSICKASTLAWSMALVDPCCAAVLGLPVYAVHHPQRVKLSIRVAMTSFVTLRLSYADIYSARPSRELLARLRGKFSSTRQNLMSLDCDALRPRDFITELQL